MSKIVECLEHWCPKAYASLRYSQFVAESRPQETEIVALRSGILVGVGKTAVAAELPIGKEVVVVASEPRIVVAGATRGELRAEVVQRIAVLSMLPREQICSLDKRDYSFLVSSQ